MAVQVPPPSFEDLILDRHLSFGKALFESGLFSDCIVRCRDRTWRLHRAVLSQRCEFFRACFAGGFRESSPQCLGGAAEVVMDEDEVTAVERMLRWLYTISYPTLEATGSADDTDADQQQLDAERLPTAFFTSELSLLVLADKYDLLMLTHQARMSIMTGLELMFPQTLSSTSISDTSKPNLESHVSRPDLIEDFITMLTTLYLDLDTTSPELQNCRESVVDNSCLTLADLLPHNERLRDISEQNPEFAIDLVNALKTKVVEKRGHEEAVCDCGHRSVRRKSSGSGDGSDSSSIASSTSGKVYIPMNEDSDDEE